MKIICAKTSAMVRKTAQRKRVFKETTDELTGRVAKFLDDACSLLEAGFEHVTDMVGVKLFRKRK